MIDLDAVIAVALLLLWVYCIFDVVASDNALIRNLPKTFWLMIVIILPDVGSLAWLLLGRPEKAGWRPGDTAQREERWAGGRRRAQGPDDVPLISESMAERERLIAQWEAEEAARKQQRREQVDMETQARKRAAEEVLIDVRRKEREAERLKAMELQFPPAEDPSQP